MDLTISKVNFNLRDTAIFRIFMSINSW